MNSTRCAWSYSLTSSKCSAVSFPVRPIHERSIALGEMAQARDLLSMLLSTAGPLSTPSVVQLLSQSTLSSSQSAPPPPPPPHNLTATVVTKPPPILSVRAFNAQLAVGGKDRALRRAADLFKAAAENMEAGRARSESYWYDALCIRRGNWGLVPAPLPPGSATGKGADKTSKDFLVSFGLEEGVCSRHHVGVLLTFLKAPAIFRRRAIGCMPTLDRDQSRIEFPLRQNTRLRVVLRKTCEDGTSRVATNVISVLEETTLEESLRAAQIEVVEQEIFSTLIKEAGSLPTATAHVSERSIVIKAAQGADLTIQLVCIPYSETTAPVLTPYRSIVTASTMHRHRVPWQQHATSLPPLCGSSCSVFTPTCEMNGFSAPVPSGLRPSPSSSNHRPSSCLSSTCSNTRDSAAASARRLNVSWVRSTAQGYPRKYTSRPWQGVERSSLNWSRRRGRSR